MRILYRLSSDSTELFFRIYRYNIKKITELFIKKYF